MDIPLNGNLRDISLVKILVFLNRNRNTGVLSVSFSSCTKNIYLKLGDVIFASSTYEDDRLGEMLLKAGTITVDQYDRAVAALTSSNKRLGAILVELGYLTPKELFRGLKYQVNEIIQSVFLLEDAAYEFREGAIPAQEVIALRMSMGNLIYAGVNRIINWTRIRNEMPDIASVLKLTDDPLSLFQDIELSAQDKRMLSLIDGKKTIREVIDSSWMGSFEALKILYVLWSTGMIEQMSAPEEINIGTAADVLPEDASLDDILRPLSEEEETPISEVNELFSKLGSLSFDELLGVNEDTDSETIKKNYYRLTKHYHPDRHFALADPESKTKLAAICDALNKAYEILRDERRRQEYYHAQADRTLHEAGEAHGDAEKIFEKGIAEYKKGNFWEAIERFKEAITLKPESPAYFSYLSLAYSKVPGKLKEAEAVLIQAIALEPFNADLFTNLGLIYIKGGLKKRALTSFQKALRIDPHHEKAKKGMEQTKQ